MPIAVDLDHERWTDTAAASEGQVQPVHLLHSRRPQQSALSSQKDPERPGSAACLDPCPLRSNRVWPPAQGGSCESGVEWGLEVLLPNWV